MTDADAAAGPTTSSTLPRAEAESSRPEEKGNESNPDHIKEMLPRTLSRLTAGLPMHELDVIIKEAKACEDAL